MKKSLRENIASIIIYILVALAILVGIGRILINPNMQVAEAAGEGESVVGDSGVTFYRAYRIYEQVVNADGKNPVSYPDVATQMGYLLDEGLYRYEHSNTSADDMFRRVNLYWYETSGFKADVAAKISDDKNNQNISNFEKAYTYSQTNGNLTELTTLVNTIKTNITADAVTLSELGATPISFYKHVDLDANYYLSYNEFARAAKANNVEITYKEVAKQIGNLLDEGIRRYKAGEANYYECFTNSYGSWYETSGFEKKVMAYISGSRVTAVELQFAKVKQAAGSGAGTDVDASVIEKEADALKEMLNVDAEKLDKLLGLGTDGDSSSSLAWATFIGCFTILVREGLEAILIVGAMVAYLIKSANKNKVKYIYIGSAVALVASALLAWLLYSLQWTGVPQEIIEGVTALIAVGVLIYVSNWMISKAESDAWTKYISGKVSGSVDNGNAWALGFTAFLAVFREGAEVILFYQPLVSSASSVVNGGWAIAGGIIAGIVVVALVYVLIRVFGVKIPLKPFFMATSILMAAMSIIFLGSGIWELFIDGGLWPVGIISGIEHWAENDILNFFGIYPTWLTIIPQLVLLAITIVTFVLWIKKGNKDKQKINQESQQQENETSTQEGVVEDSDEQQKENNPV